MTWHSESVQQRVWWRQVVSSTTHLILFSVEPRADGLRNLDVIRNVLRPSLGRWEENGTAALSCHMLPWASWTFCHGVKKQYKLLVLHEFVGFPHSEGEGKCSNGSLAWVIAQVEWLNACGCRMWMCCSHVPKSCRTWLLCKYSVIEAVPVISLYLFSLHLVRCKWGSHPCSLAAKWMSGNYWMPANAAKECERQHEPISANSIK